MEFPSGEVIKNHLDEITISQGEHILCSKFMRKNHSVMRLELINKTHPITVRGKKTKTEESQEPFQL
jgi:hypothetical protein